MTETAITVKRAGPSDCTAVMALRKALWEGEMKSVAGQNGGLSQADHWALFHDTLGFLLNPYSILLMALDGDVPIGMIAVQTGATFGMLKSDTVSVVWLYVEPDHRNGQAITTLIRTAEEAITQNKAVTVQAAVRSANTDVLDAAGRLGYNPIAVILEKKHERTHSRPAASERTDAGLSPHVAAGPSRPPEQP